MPRRCQERHAHGARPGSPEGQGDGHGCLAAVPLGLASRVPCSRFGLMPAMAVRFACDELCCRSAMSGLSVRPGIFARAHCFCVAHAPGELVYRAQGRLLDAFQSRLRALAQTKNRGIATVSSQIGSLEVDRNLSVHLPAVMETEMAGLLGAPPRLAAHSRYPLI